MFTGIVTAVGTVAKATRETGLAPTLRAPYRGLKKGESIAVNGACLTVDRVLKGGFQVHVVETTRDRTLFADYARGRRVNLERALRAADRLGGHLVQGHVDGVAERSEEHTSELQSRLHLVCRLLLEKKKKKRIRTPDL